MRASAPSCKTQTGRSGSVVAVCTSPAKGMKKRPSAHVQAVAGFGLEGDAHAGDPVRQVSLLAIESIRKLAAGDVALSPGDFAENITTEGIDPASLKIGDRLRVGQAFLEISQIGKRCHGRCAVAERIGDCAMPREGLFARVIEGGRIEAGDNITHVAL